MSCTRHGISIEARQTQAQRVPCTQQAAETKVCISKAIHTDPITSRFRKMLCHGPFKLSNFQGKSQRADSQEGLKHLTLLEQLWKQIGKVLQLL